MMNFIGWVKNNHVKPAMPGRFVVYEDGGVAAFDEACRAVSLDDAQISAIAKRFDVFARIKGLVALFFLFLGIFSKVMIVPVIVLMFMSWMDIHRRWQFRQRRFGDMIEFIEWNRAKDLEEDIARLNEKLGVARSYVKKM